MKPPRTLCAYAMPCGRFFFPWDTCRSTGGIPYVRGWVTAGERDERPVFLKLTTWEFEGLPVIRFWSEE